MLKGHLPEVLDIESENDDAWDEDDLLKLLRNYTCEAVVVVSRVAGKSYVVGYMIHENQEDKQIVHRFSVTKQFRRTGIGTQLFERIKKKNIEVLIDDDKLDVHLFLKKLGFQAIKVIGDKYKFLWGKK